MKESDILYERGAYWICLIRGAHHVMKSGITHSETVQPFGGDADGLSLAKAYVDYCFTRDARRR